MKLSLFQDHLREKKIELAIFVHPDPAISYFTQTKFSYALFLVTPSSATIYTTQLDVLPSFSDIEVKILSKQWEKELKNETSKKKERKKNIFKDKIGVNKEMLLTSFSEKLEKIFPSASFVNVGEKVNELRLQKTTEEYQNIKKACEITTQAFEAVVQELPKKTLSTEVDVALFLESYMRRQGAELAFPTIAASGKNSATPHHQTSIQKLQKGFLQLDFGAQWKNYCADMSRVIYLGVPFSEERERYQLLLQVQEKCISEVKEGKPYYLLDAFARKKLGKFSKYFIHGLGHGIGTEVHEAPVFKNRKAKVQKNVPFTIEPGIYFLGKYGLRIEDTVIWNGKTVEVLTKASKELQVVNW